MGWRDQLKVTDTVRWGETAEAQQDVVSATKGIAKAPAAYFEEGNLVEVDTRLRGVFYQ